MNRRIIFITGSHHSGKSRLGHMLATYEDCLFNYTTPSPQEYFYQSNGSLIEPRESTLIALKKLVIKQCEFLSGALSPHDNKPWLRGDQLFDYNYKPIFENKYMVNKHEHKSIDPNKFFFKDILFKKI